MKKYTAHHEKAQVNFSWAVVQTSTMRTADKHYSNSETESEVGRQSLISPN